MPSETADKIRAYYEGPKDEQGMATVRLDEEPSDENGEPVAPVPARNLTEREYQALSTRNKERVREAKDNGKPLYRVLSLRELAGDEKEPKRSEPDAAAPASDADAKDGE